jgi:hypothetical protein
MEIEKGENPGTLPENEGRLNMNTHILYNLKKNACIKTCTYMPADGYI